MATKIRVELAKRDLSGRQLAQSLGKSPAYISECFRGDRTISRPVLAKVCETLHIEPRDFFDEKGRALEYCEQ